MTVVIETGGRPSSGAQRLARALIIKKLNTDTTWQPQRGDTIINWGCARERFEDGVYINKPEDVARAGSKRRSFGRMRRAHIQIPEFTTTSQVAQQWLAEGHKVIARTVDQGHGGRGMVMLNEHDILIDGPLFVKYISKKYEYRVHVANNRAIDTQMKRRRNGLEREDVNYQIRVASNGWVYCRGGVAAPQQVLDQALLAVQALRLDFGAVDIGYTVRTERATVYEVNTAPGIEGLTVNLYADNLRRIINERGNA